jgi:uridine kinase
MGITAAGKTTFARELRAVLENRGRQVIHAPLDDFHRLRADRFALGSDSPDGHYLFSYDHSAVRRVLLEPLGPGGSRHYRVVSGRQGLDGDVEPRLEAL